jgi:hypothetical protein
VLLLLTAFVGGFAARGAHRYVVVVSSIGIDTGKNTLHLVGLDNQATIVLREKVARGRIRTRFANVAPCEAGMATPLAKRIDRNVLSAVARPPQSPMLPSRSATLTRTTSGIALRGHRVASARGPTVQG